MLNSSLSASQPFKLPLWRIFCLGIYPILTVFNDKFLEFFIYVEHIGHGVGKKKSLFLSNKLLFVRMMVCLVRTDLLEDIEAVGSRDSNYDSQYAMGTREMQTRREMGSYKCFIN